MARIAGDEATYAWRICQRSKQGKDTYYTPTEYGVDSVSISTIAKAVSDKSGPLTGWAWNIITEGVAHLAQFNEMRGWDQDKLKGALKDAGFTPWVKRARAAARGNEAHEVLERLMKGEDPEQVAKAIEAIENEEVRGYASGVMNWFLEAGAIKPLIVEEPVWFLHGQIYTGQLDLFALRLLDAQDDDPVRPVLTDLKTSKDVYAEHWLQLDGYDNGVRHGRPDLPIPELHSVLLVNAEGEYRELYREPHPEWFLHAVDLYGSMKAYEVARAPWEKS